MFTTQTPDHLEVHKGILAWWLVKNNNATFQKSGQQVESQSAKEIGSDKDENAYERYANTPLAKIIKAMIFASSSLNPATNLSVSENMKGKKKEDSTNFLIDVLSSQGSVDETLHRKLKKWQMAHSNFIA